MKFSKIGLAAAIALASTTLSSEEQIEETTVIADRLFSDTSVVSPTSKITAEELELINLMTAEDAVAYEPSLVIRRRYVGDPNGVMGIRGSGMFQTARSLVYADGLPLHYLLQTRWSGSPRWSLVGPDEIESAEVIYGPYSAEYAGNAMGGVVDIKTRTPEERRFTLQGTLMSQQYDELGTDDTFNGNKTFMSYEDRIGDFTVFASYNRLENESHPMTNYDASTDEIAALEAAGVTGYFEGQDDRGNDVIWIGDSGADDSETELYKLKLGYDLGSVQLRGTIAYEDKYRSETNKNNYLVDAEGNSYWGLAGSDFQDRSYDRESLLLGFGISGELGQDWVYDIYATDFEVLKDQEIRSGRSPLDPSYDPLATTGRETNYEDTGWNTLDIKLGTESLLGNESMRLSVGLAADEYQMRIEPFNTIAGTGERTSARDVSAGKTSTTAVFAQWGYAFNEQWDLALGLRYEDWETSDGLYNEIEVESRSETGTSPKFSLAYTPNDDWAFRYSIARALRFPIAEELYRYEDATDGTVLADATLAPEDGTFQNLSFERFLETGSVKVNVFHEKVDDTIYNLTNVIADVTTFLSVDQVETKGIEFIYNNAELLGTKASLRFNATYSDAEITENAGDPSIVGNEMPRIPEWRANMILGYPVTESVDLSTSFRYSSDTYGDLDNGDTSSGVYGAIDDYFFVNARANWQVNENASLSFGIDNIFDDLSYVAHPWPSRTLYLEGKYSF